ncbi:MAG: ATP-binding protein [Burkholderiaceae bacterium]|nr:ATP-binding protein [Burkholderiaceae bacterium]
MARLADRLRAHAAAHFVGRATELALIGESLAVDPPPISVFVVHGPGGVGKTSLLERVRALAAAHGIDTLRLDARDLQPSPAGLLQVLGSALGLAAADADLQSVVSRWSVTPRRLLLIDTFERIANLEHWLREIFLPELPDRTVVVLAGRAEPDAAWITDPLWREGARVIALENLTPAECEQLLAARGIARQHHGPAVRLSYGHPLALTLLADDIAARGAVPNQLGSDMISRLVQRFTDDAPTALHRRALEVCAMARATDEELLADVVDRERATELFDWLSAQSFIESGPGGLFPHDLARDAIDEDMRRRQYERQWEVRASINRCLVQRIASHKYDLARLAFDMFFLMRRSAVLRSFIDFGAVGSAWFERADAGDAGPLRLLLEAELGPAQAAAFEHWRKHKAAATWVVKPAPGQVVGATLSIDLARLGAGDFAADATCGAVWQALQSVAPPQPGDSQLLMRWTVSSGGQHLVSPAMNALQVCHVYQWLTTPALGAFVLCLEQPDHWIPMMERIRFHRLDGCDLEIDGVAHGCYLHDFRAEPVARYFQTMRTPRSTWAAAPPVLSRPDFELAVRDALKGWHDRAALAGNPLAKCHAVLGAASEGEAPAATLQRLLLETARALQDKPRDVRFWRALEMTFFRPAGSQELAAERLAIPFGTYRYQLATGIAKITERLWTLQKA